MQSASISWYVVYDSMYQYAIMYHCMERYVTGGGARGRAAGQAQKDVEDECRKLAADHAARVDELDTAMREVSQRALTAEQAQKLLVLERDDARAERDGEASQARELQSRLEQAMSDHRRLMDETDARLATMMQEVRLAQEEVCRANDDGQKARNAAGLRKSHGTSDYECAMTMP